MIIQYRPVAHPDQTGMGSLKWIELGDAGWDVEYEEPRDYFKNCGVRATKEFETLMQGVMEWEMLTGCSIQAIGPAYKDSLSKAAVGALPRRMKFEREKTYLHAFVINPGEKDEEVLVGKDLKKALKVRINV